MIIVALKSQRVSALRKQEMKRRVRGEIKALVTVFMKCRII
jgi:hypothetical protein